MAVRSVTLWLRRQLIEGGIRRYGKQKTRHASGVPCEANQVFQALAD